MYGDTVEVWIRVCLNLKSDTGFWQEKRLRKVLYQVMMSLVMHKIPKDDAVYRFIKKKEAEGKYKKVAKVAGMAKFLRIYYGRVMHLYRDLGLAA